MKHLRSRRTVALILTIFTPLAAHAGPFDSIAGRWQGQAEYYANTAAGPIGAAHAIIPLVVEIDSGGKITGQSPENGRQLLGLVTASSSSTNFRLQVTLTNCRAELMNRRYQGQLAHYMKKARWGSG